MAENETEETTKEHGKRRRLMSKWEGIPASEEELKEIEEDFKLIQESIEDVLENGEDL